MVSALRVMAFSMCTLALAACNNSKSDNDTSDGSGSTATANVALASISSPTSSQVRAGETFSLDFSISSTNLETQHVGVSFVAIAKDKVSDLEDNESPDLYELGQYYVAQLQEGEQSFSVSDLMFPLEEVPAGEYVIAAYVDTSGVIADEADTTDNRSRNYDTQSSTYYGAITVDATNYYDIVLDKVTVGKGYAMFPGPGITTNHVEGTPTHKKPDLIGYFYASQFGKLAEDMTISATITIGETTYPAHLWDLPNTQYASTMTVAPPKLGLKENSEATQPDSHQSHYYPWDIGINATLLKAIQDDFDANAEENSLTLTFTIAESDKGEANTDNNVLSIKVPYVLYEDSDGDDDVVSASATAFSRSAMSRGARSSSTISKYTSFDNTYGDKDSVALALEFYAKMYAKSTYGYAKAYSDMDLYMFGDSADLLYAQAYGKMTVSDLEISYGVDFDVLGYELIDESDSVSAINESWPYDWEETQTIFETTFTIVIVPVTVEAGVTGSLGTEPGIVFSNSQLDVGGDLLSAGLDAYATAEINLGVASGGVGVDFTIFSDTFNTTGYVDVSKVGSSQMTLGMTATNDLTAIEGEFYAYVKYYTYSFCCSVNKKTKTYTIYDTDALYDKSWTLLDQSSTVSW